MLTNEVTGDSKEALGTRTVSAPSGTIRGARKVNAIEIARICLLIQPADITCLRVTERPSSANGAGEALGLQPARPHSPEPSRGKAARNSALRRRRHRLFGEGMVLRRGAKATPKPNDGEQKDGSRQNRYLRPLGLEMPERQSNSNSNSQKAR